MLSSMTRGFFVIIGVLLFAHCSTSRVVSDPAKIRLEKDHYRSFDGDSFPYQTWTPKEEPELVVIGVHGISGAGSDYKPLGNHLLSSLPRTAIYAAETRGQGNDPVKERRGHIRNREEWFRDLTTFTGLIRKKHPKARIVWCGESMGSLIVLHSYAYSAERDGAAVCDAMILASPIVDIRGDFPKWKELAVKTVATLFPTFRISLEGLSGENNVRVTKDTVHSEQAATNSYHIKRHTLRLLTTLGDMIRKMKGASQTLDIPILVLHGGKDVFSDPNDVIAFTKNLPAKATSKRIFYAESFHLLFHDHQSDKVVADIGKWLKKLPKP